MKIWTLTYIDDNYADEFGAKVFLSEEEAEAAYNRHMEQNDPENPSFYAVVQSHEIEQKPAASTAWLANVSRDSLADMIGYPGEEKSV